LSLQGQVPPDEAERLSLKVTVGSGHERQFVGRFPSLQVAQVT